MPFSNTHFQRRFSKAVFWHRFPMPFPKVI
jgi:hypothetical protein